MIRTHFKNFLQPSLLFPPPQWHVAFRGFPRGGWGWTMVLVALAISAAGEVQGWAAPILGKVIQAYGGKDRLESLGSIKMLQGPIHQQIGDTVIWRRGDKTRVEFSTPIGVETTILSAAHALFIDHEGKEALLDPAIARSLQAPLFLTYFPYQLSMLLTLGVSETTSDDEHSILTFTHTDTVVQLHVDPNTYLIESATAQSPKGDPLRFRYERYQGQEGVPFPFRRKFGFKSEEVTVKTMYLALTLDLGDALFEPLGVVEIGEAPSVRVPIRVPPGQHIFVTLTLGTSGPHELVFDTGASFTSLDIGFARSIGLRGAAHSFMGTMQGMLETELINLPFANMGGVMFKDCLWSILPLKQLSPNTHTGVVGAGLLKTGPCEINFVENTLTIYRPDTFQPPSGAVPLTLKFYQNIPIVTVQVNDTVNSDMLVDTGALNLNVLFFGNFFTENKMKRDELSSIRLSRTSFPIPSNVIKLGGMAGHAGSQGLIGLNFFRDRFTRVVFDRPRRILWCVPKALLGIQFAQGLTPELKRVDEGSAAQQAGLQVGDVFAALNGQEVSTVQEARSILAKCRPGETLKCAVLRGVQRVEIPVQLRPAFE